MKGKKIVNILSVILIILGGLGLVTGVIFLIIGGISFLKYKSFCSDAIKTTGYVESVISSPSKTSINYLDDEGNFYEVTYNYETSLAQEGDQVDLYYAENDSTDVRVKGFDTLFSLIFFIIGGVFISVAIGEIILILVGRGIAVSIMKKKQTTV